MGPVWKFSPANFKTIFEAEVWGVCGVGGKMGNLRLKQAPQLIQMHLTKILYDVKLDAVEQGKNSPSRLC